MVKLKIGSSKKKKRAKPIKKKIGRPRKYTVKRIKDIIKKINAYIKSEEIPIVAEFAYKNNVRRQALYEYSEFSDTIKKLIAKKEANLEKLALVGAINPTMAIFSLKQLGWSDRRDLNIAATINKTDRKIIEINYKEDNNEKLAGVARILQQIGAFPAEQN